MRTQHQDLRDALYELAAAQRGYFTAAQARNLRDGLGYSYQAQRHHVIHGNWTRVERGIFRLPYWPIADDDHLVRWALWSNGRAVISHQTALVAHGLGDVDPTRVHLTVPPNFRKAAPGITLHRQNVSDQDVEDRGGYKVTRPTRALAECGAAGLAQELLDGAVSEALERGQTTRRRLRDAAHRLGPQAGLAIELAIQAAT